MCLTVTHREACCPAARPRGGCPMPEIVYEDNHLIVAVKPPNLLTQGDATGDDCLLDRAEACISRNATTSRGTCTWGWCTGWTGPWAGWWRLRARARRPRGSERAAAHPRTWRGSIWPWPRAAHPCRTRGEPARLARAGRGDGRVCAASPRTHRAPKEARLSFRVLGRDAALDTTLCAMSGWRPDASTRFACSWPTAATRS